MKKLLAILLTVTLLFSVTGCSEVLDLPEGEAKSWAIYWYLCGSDLETNGGFATMDLQEMLAVELPENVKVVIQTGGSAVWQNNVVDSAKLQRFLYDSEGLRLVNEQPSASMGDADTLAEFLSFAKENYPADKTVVTFWNHGGGSVSGAAFDEIYGNDSLSLSEMQQAFTSVWEPDGKNPPLELVGFDTCLMATVDVANTFYGLSHYLVGSEEVEPGNGWYYSGWLGALAEDPRMSGEELGVAICDSYYAGCKAVGTHERVTLSLTDLTRLDGLMKAYEAFGAEALAAACEDPSFFSVFARAAFQSENYGGNTREQGYTNMVDLGHLARLTADTLQTAEPVLDALEDCVVYRVNGRYRAEATGLSCYYSYNGDMNDLNGYTDQGAGTAFKHYFSYGLTGDLSESGKAYIADWDVTELLEIPSLSSMGWDDADLELNDEGDSVLTLGPQATDVLSGIGFSLYLVDEENDTMMYLGTDNDIEADWENGIFTDNFRGRWGSIDGNLVYMELSFEGDDYNLYSVPILLNGEDYNLQVVYDFTAEEWSVLGATRGIDENGMADKEIRLLEAGDKITTLWYLATVTGEDGFETYRAATVTVTKNTAFGEMILPDGLYRLVFEMRDATGDTVYSEPVDFTCTDGEIITTLHD